MWTVLSRLRALGVSVVTSLSLSLSCSESSGVECQEAVTGGGGGLSASLCHSSRAGDILK